MPLKVFFSIQTMLQLKSLLVLKSRQCTLLALREILALNKVVLLWFDLTLINGSPNEKL